MMKCMCAYTHTLRCLHHPLHWLFSCSICCRPRPCTPRVPATAHALPHTHRALLLPPPPPHTHRRLLPPAVRGTRADAGPAPAAHCGVRVGGAGGGAAAGAGLRVRACTRLPFAALCGVRVGGTGGGVNACAGVRVQAHARACACGACVHGGTGGAQGLGASQGGTCHHCQKLLANDAPPSSGTCLHCV